ncbi:MAG TPA: ricin-type beta-trefoil lectin domain protein [Streptosporangiaceae bacterium]|nr:ricin-type beta-trefoil lectin domain protein [Streptosporangiaceae bacterium]
MSPILGRCLRSAFARLGTAGLLALAATLMLAPSVSGVAAAATPDPQGMIIGGGGRCIGTAGGSINSGALLQLQDCTGASTQTWEIVSNGTLVGVNGLCMDVQGGRTADGTLVQAWTCNGTGAQQWQRSGNALVNPQSGRCIDAQSTHTVAGTGLQIWDCISGAPQQSWTMPPPNQTPELVIASGVGHTGQITEQSGCLDEFGDDGAIETMTLVAQCDPTAVGQQWTVEPDGTIQTQGRCLDVAGAGTADGTEVQVWDCNGTVAQQWQWNGTLVNPHSGKCLDTPGDAGAGGPSLVIATCNGKPAQNWTLPLSNREVALGTGKALLSNPQTPGIALGTSPSVTPYLNGNEIAFNGPGGLLWVTDPDGHTHRALNLNLAVAPQTSPSITTGQGGFWKIAFQGANGDLWFADQTTGTAQDFGPQMEADTSPAIVGMTTGYETALIAASGQLWIVGRDGFIISQGLPDALGSSPTIASLGLGQTWAAAYRATDGTLHLEFPNGAGGLFDHATGQAVMDGTSPAATANSTEPSPEVAFAGSDGNLRLLSASGTVLTAPAGSALLAGGTSPAIAVDVNGGTGHFQIAWQAQTEHTLWTWSNDIFGQHADDWLDLMGPQTSPALSKVVSLSQVVCCTGGGGGVGGGGVGGG